MEAVNDPNGAVVQAVIETWMLLEYADRGSLEQAIASRRFVRKADQALDMVRFVLCYPRLQSLFHLRFKSAVAKAPCLYWCCQRASDSLSLVCAAHVHCHWCYPLCILPSPIVSRCVTHTHGCSVSSHRAAYTGRSWT